MNERYSYKDYVKNAIDEKKPELNHKLNSSSRWGSTPPWKNTFLNFQPSVTSPQFMGENDRLVANSKTRTSYQWAEKAQDKKYSDGRSNRIRTHTDSFRHKIENDAKEMDRKEDIKLKKIGAQVLQYEHVNHLKNPYF